MELSHSKEEQIVSAFLHTVVGLMVKRTKANTHTSACYVGIKPQH